jgi:hypothetical protein
MAAFTAGASAGNNAILRLEMATAFEPKRLRRQVWEEVWHDQPLYKATLKELRASARKPGQGSELTKGLEVHRISRSDALSHADPASRLALQKASAAFINVVSDGLAIPGTAFARALFKASTQLKEKPEPIGHISVPELILFAIIHSREELQEACLNWDTLRIRIERYRGKRLDDTYWRKCLKRPALQNLISAISKK